MAPWVQRTSFASISRPGIESARIFEPEPERVYATFVQSFALTFPAVLLAGAATSIGGVISITLFFYSPFYTYNVQDRSRFLGILFFLIVALVTSYLAARTRRDAAAAVKRENEIRELYTFSQRLSAASSHHCFAAATRASSVARRSASSRYPI